MVRSASDEAWELKELIPIEMFPFAVHIHGYEGSYNAPFRRYRTLAHAKSAVKGVQGWSPCTIYQFNFQTDEWEKLDEY